MAIKFTNVSRCVRAKHGYIPAAPAIEKFSKLKIITNQEREASVFLRSAASIWDKYASLGRKRVMS